MKLPLLSLIIASLALAAPILPASARKSHPQPQPAPARIVFLGDSISDGDTYPLLVQAAIRATGAPAPIVINAGIGGDTALGMSNRIDRDVLVHHPTLVTLSAGANDALHGVSLADYSKSMTAIADKLRDAKIPLILLTTTSYGAKLATAEKLGDQYNAWLRTFGAERGLKMAEVNTIFKQARDKDGEATIMEVDGVHPNWEGQRLIARAVLDALGYTAAAVPATLKPDLMPGVITPWRIRISPDGKPLTDPAAADLSKDLAAARTAGDQWHEYTLPETVSQEHPWKDQERQRGFALSLDKLIGAGKTYQGFATLENKTSKPQRVYFNVGAQLQTIWLNGERIYQSTGWLGWHAGRERIAAIEKPGPNTVLIESGTQFFLSVTDDNQW